MNAKKKTRGKPAKSKRTAGKEATSKKLVKKRPILKKKSAKRKPAQKKGVKPKVIGKKAAKTRGTPKKRVRGNLQSMDSAVFLGKRPRTAAGGQSGDLQGLSRVEGADSESVDELLEEGNAFEADVVAGVEQAGNSEGKEVHTHEVPEDDVPEEYLDDKER